MKKHNQFARRWNLALFSSVVLLAALATGCGNSTPLAVTASGTVVIGGQTLQFAAAGGGKSPLIWSVNSVDGGNATVGTITSGGLYTAPVTPPSPNSVTVTATRSKKVKQTDSLAITVNYASPTLTAITPPTVTADGAGISVTLTGTGFTPATAGLADATALTMTFVSSTEVTALIPGAVAGTVSAPAITVNNPTPGGGTSSSLTLPIFGLGVVTTTANAQVARYTIETPVDADVNVEFGLTTSYGTPTWSVAAPGGGGIVEILVAGMKSFSDYNMRASAAIPGGPTHLDANQTFTTLGLDPATLPTFTVTKHATLLPTPGIKLLSLVRSPAMPIVALDEDANVIWYYDQGNGSAPRFLPDGTIFTFEDDPDPAGTNAIRIVNLAGETLKYATATTINQQLIGAGKAPNANRFHHDMQLLPNGHYVVLTYFDRDFVDLVGLPGTTTVQLDGIVELDQNLVPVWTWNTIDDGGLAIDRHPFTSFWPNPGGIYDHTHNNGLEYSPTDGNLIVSIRHQHWIVKIDFQDGMGTGAILWKLGFEGDFGVAPVGGDIEDWGYATHYPSLLDTTLGTFRMTFFDNGNQRPDIAGGSDCLADPTVDCFSRAPVFELNETLMTATLLWEDVHPFFSPIIGSSMLLPGNRILNDSGAIGGPAVSHALIREVTMDVASELVWQLDIQGWLVFRAVHHPSLYPGVQW